MYLVSTLDFGMGRIRPEGLLMPNHMHNLLGYQNGIKYNLERKMSVVVHQKSLTSRRFFPFASLQFQPSVLDDDDRDFKRTRRTTDSSDKITSSVVSSSGDRSRKRRGDDESRFRGDYSKFAKEESGGIRHGDSESHDDQGSRSKSDGAHYDNATYPIPSAMHRERSNKHLDGQDGLMQSGFMNSHDDSRGRRGSPSWDRRGGRMGRGRYRDNRFRDDRLRHGREERERSGSRKSRCRDYDGMNSFFFYYYFLEKFVAFLFYIVGMLRYKG